MSFGPLKFACTEMPIAEKPRNEITLFNFSIGLVCKEYCGNIWVTSPEKLFKKLPVYRYCRFFRVAIINIA